MILTFIAGFFGISFIYLIWQYLMQLWKLRYYPPGPIPFPLIGNLHQLRKSPLLTLKDFAKQYGDVFSISLGHKRIVVVNSVTAAREALIQKSVEFAGRPQDIYTAGKITRGFKDIAFGDFGPVWQATRKLAHQSLKLYGSGMERMEDFIQEEADDLCVRLGNTKGQPVNPHQDLGKDQVVLKLQHCLQHCQHCLQHCNIACIIT